MVIENALTCGVCHKKLVLARFSNSAISKYRQNVQYQASRHGKAQATLPSCRSCTPGARIELTCTDCHRTKELDFFSKRQRQNPDNARCLDCQQVADDREPDTEAAIAEVEECERLKFQSTIGSTYEHSAMTSQLSQIKLSGNSTKSKENTNTESGAATNSWLGQDYSRKGTSTGADQMSNDRQRAGSTNTNISQSSTPSTTNNSRGTWANFVQTPRATSRVSAVSNDRRGGSNPGFVKQNAVKESIEDKAIRRHERDTRIAREYGKADDDEMEKSDSDSSEFEL